MTVSGQGYNSQAAVVPPEYVANNITPSTQRIITTALAQGPNPVTAGAANEVISNLNQVVQQVTDIDGSPASYNILPAGTVAVAALTVGQTLSQATSGATATIAYIIKGGPIGSTAVLGVTSVTGTFDTTHLVTASGTGTFTPQDTLFDVWPLSNSVAIAGNAVVTGFSSATMPVVFQSSGGPSTGIAFYVSNGEGATLPNGIPAALLTLDSDGVTSLILTYLVFATTASVPVLVRIPANSNPVNY